MKWVEHEESLAILRRARTIAVLGIKPESRNGEAAFWIPEYLASVGYQIFPVPTHFPDSETILGSPTNRLVSDIRADLDIVSVFQRPADVPKHLDDLVAASPVVVWFQSGCVDRQTAQELWKTGIEIVCSCIGCTRATIVPPTDPLPAQLDEHR